MSNPQPAQPESATPDFGERVCNRCGWSRTSTVGAEIVRMANDEFATTLAAHQKELWDAQAMAEAQAEQIVKLEESLDAMRRRAEAAEEKLERVRDMKLEEFARGFQTQSIRKARSKLAYVDSLLAALDAEPAAPSGKSQSYADLKSFLTRHSLALRRESDYQAAREWRGGKIGEAEFVARLVDAEPATPTLDDYTAPPAPKEEQCDCPGCEDARAVLEAKPREREIAEKFVDATRYGPADALNLDGSLRNDGGFYIGFIGDDVKVRPAGFSRTAEAVEGIRRRIAALLEQRASNTCSIAQAVREAVAAERDRCIRIVDQGWVGKSVIIALIRSGGEPAEAKR